VTNEFGSRQVHTIYLFSEHDQQEIREQQEEVNDSVEGKE
jgi:hypothetical protein